MNLLHDLSPGKKAPEVFNAVIEIAKGSRNKYEYDKETGLFQLDRVLYSPFFYPFEYGFVPQSLYDDGDPMDVMVLMNEPTFPGCIIEVRPIAVFEMTDKGDRDDKILAVPTQDPFFADYKDIGNVSAHYLKEVQHFFEAYKHLEGKKVDPIGWKGAADAKKALVRSLDLYTKKK